MALMPSAMSPWHMLSTATLPKPDRAKTAKGGFWVTTIMYTENEADAAGFKEVLLRWQSKGYDKNKDKTPDLIQIGKKK